MADHDGRLKNLIPETLGDLLRLAVPEWAGRFEVAAAEWLQQELFPDPPRGGSRRIDLVARVPVNEPLGEATTTLVHVEIESRDRAADLRRRMAEYNGFLEHRHALPTLSIGLYLRVGLGGIGWDRFEGLYWGRRKESFEYPYVGLPALEAFEYVAGDNLLAVALVGLMRSPEERRAELKAEAMQRVATAAVNEYRRGLLFECVEAYMPLEEPHLAEFLALLQGQR